MTPSVPEEPATDEPELKEGPGRRLKRAREAAGISIGEVSARLHLDIKTVRAIEGDDYVSLPGPAFVRGYLRGYARMLNLPVEPLVQLFDVHGLAPPTLVADISERPQAKSSDFPVQIFTWLIVLGLGVLVFLWWRGQVFSTDAGLTSESNQETNQESGQTGFVVRATQPGADEGEPVRASGSSDVPGSTPGTNQADGSEQQPLPGQVEPPLAGATEVPPEDPSRDQPDTSGADSDATLAATATSEASPGPRDDSARTSLDSATQVQGERAADGSPSDAADTAATTASDAATPPVTSNSPEQLTAAAVTPGAQSTGDEASTAQGATSATGGSVDRLDLSFAVEAWVEVYDRDNEKLYWNLVRPGQKLALSGPGPMRVLLGKVDKVQVTFNDRPVDFSRYINRGVARFMLGPAGVAAVPESAPAGPNPQSASQ